MVTLFIEPLTTETPPDTFVPVTNDTFNAFVYHIESLDVFHLSLPDWENPGIALIAQMNEFYLNQGKFLLHAHVLLSESDLNLC